VLILNTKQQIPPELASRHPIFPYAIPLDIPGFQSFFRENIKTLTPEKVDCRAWYSEFVRRVLDCTGTSYLPVCRISDGEFEFLLGKQPLGKDWPLLQRIRTKLRSLLLSNFRAGMETRQGVGYSSGNYTKSEVRNSQREYGEHLRTISEDGVLCIHLTFGTGRPFQEHFFPAFEKWLINTNINLTCRNYAPFYFVYAMMRDPIISRTIIRGRRVLLLNSARGEKRRKIMESVQNLNAKEVLWYEVSPNRSLYEKLQVSQYVGRIDLCLVGAGVGKVSVLAQLRELSVPCIDIGFLFEVFANEKAASLRPYCIADDQHAKS
jgi:hypothetical protein